MKIAVIGGRGQLALALGRLLSAERLSFLSIGRPEGDLAEPDRLLSVLADYAPDAVINAAAYTAVDRAEEESAAAYAVNRDGVAALARSCAEHKAPLVHVSTDYVFDGSKAEPYREDDAVCPLGVYGDSKLAGEREVQRTGGCHAIIRTAWVFSADGRNFVHAILGAAQDRGSLRVVDDQTGCPTPAEDLARACLRAAIGLRERPELSGLYHFAGAPDITWFGFAQEIIGRGGHLIGRPVQLDPCSTADYPTRAQRPANSRLDSSRFAAAFGIPAADWRAGLDRVLARLATPDTVSDTLS